MVLSCILALSLVAVIPQAFACSCAADWSIEDDFAEAKNVIFSGRAVDVKTQQYSLLVTFDIEQSWKGIPSNMTSINVMTSLHSASCGYNFEKDANYLVVAYGKWDQTPEVSSCSSTTPLASAFNEISFLNKIPKNENTVGQLRWDRFNYPLNNTAATIQVIDPDMNKIAISKEMVKVHVYSDSNPEGIVLEFFETEPNSGIFEKTFVLSDTRSAPNILYTVVGDTATAKYIDTTLPEPYLPTDQLEVTDSVIMGLSGPPLERVPASLLRVEDLEGEVDEIPTILVDQQVKIVADVTNQMDRDQNFAYLVQIVDEKKTVVSLSWLTGSLTPLQSFSSAQSWTPQIPGRYEATVFVWESINNPSALSPPLSIEIIVKDANL